MQNNTYYRGLMAEIYAMVFLTLKGFRVVAWRYKTPVGEVDIIALRGKVLAFVEVKLRPDLESGLYAVTPKTQGRVARAAQHFMVSRPDLARKNPRFDVIAVSGFCLRHLDNAWHSPT